jgi:RNA polymerase sigma factor (sigma-70 family)
MERMSDSIDPEVLSTLVENHRRFLKFLEARVGSHEVAEELLQAAFVKGLERGGDLHDGESAVAWFYRLLRNALVDHWRHRDVERRALEREAAEAASRVMPPAELEAALCECVHGLIPTLKGEYSEILRRVEMEGRSVGDAAGDLGITAGNAAVRLHRARPPSGCGSRPRAVRVPNMGAWSATAVSPRIPGACGVCNGPSARPSAGARRTDDANDRGEEATGYG